MRVCARFICVLCLSVVVFDVGKCDCVYNCGCWHVFLFECVFCDLCVVAGM